MYIFAQSQTLPALANDDRANYDSSVSETGTLLVDKFFRNQSKVTTLQRSANVYLFQWLGFCQLPVIICRTPIVSESLTFGEFYSNKPKLGIKLSVDLAEFSCFYSVLA